MAQPPNKTSTEHPAPAARWAGRSGRAIACFLLIVAATLAADLGLKSWSFANVAGRPVVLTEQVTQDHFEFWSQYPHDAVVVAPKLLNLRLTTNTGAVFGLGKGNRGVFIAVSALATAVIGLLFWRSPARAWGLHLALGLILAGAIGNLYDRVRFQAVRDMLHMLPGVNLPFGLSWPGGSAGHPITEVWPWIFNPADMALMAGVGLMLIVTWRSDAKVKVQNKAQAKTQSEAGAS